MSRRLDMHGDLVLEGEGHRFILEGRGGTVTLRPQTGLRSWIGFLRWRFGACPAPVKQAERYFRSRGIRFRLRPGR